MAIIGRLLCNTMTPAKAVRSGLQKDVVDMYRRGVRNAFSKPPAVREAFLIHLRYNFHNPPLTQRDYTAIEHQLRRFDRTLDMLSDTSVQRINVSSEMENWWREQVERVRSSSAAAGSTTTSAATPAGETEVKATGADSPDAKAHGWDGRLPGPGGT